MKAVTGRRPAASGAGQSGRRRPAGCPHGGRGSADRGRSTRQSSPAFRLRSGSHDAPPSRDIALTSPPLPISRRSRATPLLYCITEVRLITFRSAIRARLVRISSCTPLAKNAFSSSMLRLSKGSTAINGALTDATFPRQSAPPIRSSTMTSVAKRIAPRTSEDAS